MFVAGSALIAAAGRGRRTRSRRRRAASEYFRGTLVVLGFGRGGYSRSRSVDQQHGIAFLFQSLRHGPREGIGSHEEDALRVGLHQPKSAVESKCANPVHQHRDRYDQEYNGFEFNRPRIAHGGHFEREHR